MADNRFLRKQRVLSLMQRIPPAVRSVARDALDEQTVFLVEQIRPRVPKDEGELRESLNWRRNPRGDVIRNIITEGLNQEGDPGNHKAFAVEFGRPDMEPQPHFFPTYRANKRKMQNAIQKRIRATIARIWGGPGK